jgi:hypothetical protein
MPFHRYNGSGKGNIAMDSETNMRPRENAGAQSPWRERWRRVRDLVPTLSVVTVVVAALAATVMVTRPQWEDANRPSVIAKSEQDVVRAPPLVVQAPPLKASQKPGGRAQHQVPAIDSKGVGAGPACSNCGVVESVAVVDQHGAFQMRIRMDDGTLRTVEQRGAVAAGSRVVLEAGSVRIMALPATRQG